MDQHPTPPVPIVATPVVKVTSASGLVSCVPYLVGFAPQDSLVLVFLTGGPPAEVAVTMRVDLVADDVAARQRGDVVASIASSLDRARACGVDLAQVHMLVFSESAATLPARMFVADLLDSANVRGVRPGEVIATDGTHMWHYGGATSTNGRRNAGERVNPDEALGVEFAMVAAGIGFVPSRQTLADSLRPDATCRVTPSQLAAQRRDRADQAQSRSGGVRWRRAVEDSLLGAMREPYNRRVAYQDAPRWALGLADSRVREPVMYRLLISTPEQVRRGRLAGARTWLTGLVTMVSGPAGAPVAATLAAVAWQQGDGAFARIAAEHSLAADPANRLGALIAAACNSGMPPATWVEVLAAFTLAQLRDPHPASEVP